MKRALFVTITDYPGGAERIAFSLASKLASRPSWRVEVKIVCSKLRDSFSQQVLPANVEVRYGPVPNWYFAFLVFPFRLLFRRYDFVFTTHVYTNALVSTLRRWRLLRIGRLVSRESTSIFDRSSGMRRRLFQWLYRRYGSEDQLIVQTAYMADHVRPWLPYASARRIRVLANPVDVRALCQDAAQPLDGAIAKRLDGSANILFCGRLTPVKQPLLALTAFDVISRWNSSASLVFIGSGPLESALRREIDARALQERVLLVSQCSNPYSIMARCQYGLITSAKEGFPNVLLEMMGLGFKKIVCTPCAGDLDKLPSLAVTRTFESAEIAGILRRAIESGENCSEAYRASAFARDVSAFLDSLLEPDDDRGMLPPRGKGRCSRA